MDKIVLGIIEITNPGQNGKELSRFNGCDFHGD